MYAKFIDAIHNEEKFEVESWLNDLNIEEHD